MGGVGVLVLSKLFLFKGSPEGSQHFNPRTTTFELVLADILHAENQKYICSVDYIQNPVLIHQSVAIVWRCQGNFYGML